MLLRNEEVCSFYNILVLFTALYADTFASTNVRANSQVFRLEY